MSTSRWCIKIPSMVSTPSVSTNYCPNSKRGRVSTKHRKKTPKIPSSMSKVFSSNYSSWRRSESKTSLIITSRTSFKVKSKPSQPLLNSASSNKKISISTPLSSITFSKFFSPTISPIQIISMSERWKFQGMQDKDDSTPSNLRGEKKGSPSHGLLSNNREKKRIRPKSTGWLQPTDWLQGTLCSNNPNPKPREKQSNKRRNKNRRKRINPPSSIALKRRLRRRKAE